MYIVAIVATCFICNTMATICSNVTTVAGTNLPKQTRFFYFKATCTDTTLCPYMGSTIITGPNMLPLFDKDQNNNNPIPTIADEAGQVSFLHVGGVLKSSDVFLNMYNSHNEDNDAYTLFNFNIENCQCVGQVVPNIITDFLG